MPGDAPLAPDRAGTLTFMTGPAGAPELRIAGNLSLPAGMGVVPAMVVIHGSGGTTPGREAYYARLLNEAGIAAFFVDSFTPRGIRSTVRDQRQLAYGDQVLDAYHALRFLHGHPRVDRARVGLMGFSRGGIVTRLAAVGSRDAAFTARGITFAAFAAFYPSCAFAPLAPVAGGPLLMLSGALDDWTPAAPCAAYTAYLRARGGDARHIVYPQGRHAWDAGGRSGSAVAIPDAITSVGCPTIFVTAQGGIDAGSGRRLSRAEVQAEMDRCIRAGPVHFGPDRDTRLASDQALLDFLRPVFAR